MNTETIMEPVDLMTTVSTSLNIDSTALTEEFQGRWQTIQSATNQLPTSMQGLFLAFLQRTGSPLHTTIEMRQQIAQALGQSATIATEVDGNIHHAFHGWE
jgi:hypothetical protein